MGRKKLYEKVTGTSLTAQIYTDYDVALRVKRRIEKSKTGKINIKLLTYPNVKEVIRKNAKTFVIIDNEVYLCGCIRNDSI